MRIHFATAIASISWTPTPVAAFFPQAPRSSGCRAALASTPRVDSLRLTKSETSEQQLPPKDETWSPFGALRELSASPDVPEDAERYDRVGGLSGGTWKSLVIGFLPSTVVTMQQGAKWLAREEAAGNVYQSLPNTVVQILGEKSFINLSAQPELHAIGRKPLSQALSPKAVLELTPTMRASVDKLITRLEGFAESGQEVALQDELRGFTQEAIVGVYFGDYATPELLENVRRFLPTITRGLFSLPVRFPWPLSQLPVLGFGASMDAREAFKSIVLSVLEERRTDGTADHAGGVGGKSAGILDSLIEIQQDQMGREDGQEGIFDDDSIVDNVITSLFAGTDTTTSTITRALQLLATDGDDIIDKLRQELSNTARSDDSELENDTGSGSGVAARPGIFASFPLLHAVVLETFRLHPAVPGVFRKALNDVSYNGYLIPSGATINMNMIHGFRANSLYDEPKKFCPLRFLHGDNGDSEDGSDSNKPRGVPAKQPPPKMFGVGRHTCPGRELSKLEMLLFFKAFLSKFDYELVGGQSFKGCLPSNGPEDKLLAILKIKADA
ncbi:unnamed protein product [Scytosiphon promiscuus]